MLSIARQNTLVEVQLDVDFGLLGTKVGLFILAAPPASTTQSADE